MVSGNRRTASSAISINYEAPRVTRKLATSGRATPAKGRPHLAGKREEARYAAIAPASVISLNYNERLGSRTGRQGLVTMDQSPLRREETRYRAPKHPLSEEKSRQMAPERQATSYMAPEQPSDVASTAGPELGKLGHGEPYACGSSFLSGEGSTRVEHVIFGGAVPAAGRPLLAEMRGDARHAVTAPPNAILFNYSVLSGATEQYLQSGHRFLRGSKGRRAMR